ERVDGGLRGGRAVRDVENVGVDVVAEATVGIDRIIVVLPDAEPRIGDRATDRADDAARATGDEGPGRQVVLQVGELAAHRAGRVDEEVDVRGAHLHVEDERVDRGRASIR